MSISHYQMGYSLVLTLFLPVLALNKFISSNTNIPDLTDGFMGPLILGIPVFVFSTIVQFNSDFEELKRKFAEGQNNKSQWKLRGFLVTGYYALSIISTIYLFNL